MKKLTHTDEKGKAVMVDVGQKTDQLRTAEAEGFISLQDETLQLIHENSIKKGDVMTVAEIAGIQAAKECFRLIPLCHPLIINKISVTCKTEDEGIRVKSMVSCTGKTGVEMEALTAVSIALLTIYDMCKAVDKSMVIGNIRLISKKKENIQDF